MSPHARSPRELSLQRYHAEVAWLRELLQMVAGELERLAAQEQPPTRRQLLARAQRIRRRLFEGPPRSRSDSR